MLGSLENMAEVNQSMMKTVNIHQSKINVVKFDGTNNFDMWRCEMMDALTASNLKDSLLCEKKSEETSQKDWDKMSWMACGVIRSYLTQRCEESRDDKNFRREDLKDPKEQIFDKKH